MDDWQNKLENPADRWVQRLWRRGEQPGVVRLAQGRDTVSRLMRWGSPSLADEVARRYGAVMALQQQMPPIVYAEPMPVVANSTAVGTAQESSPSPLPVVKLRPQITPLPSHTPLAAPAPLPVVNVPDVAQTRSAAPRPQPSSLPRPATPLSASGSPASKASMPPVVTRPPAAAPPPQPVHSMDRAAPEPPAIANPTERPVVTSSLPVVQPLRPATSPPRPATPSVIKTPSLLNPVGKVNTTPAQPVTMTVHTSAAARPQSPVHSPVVTPLTREKQGAAATHPVSTPSSTPVVTPSVTLSVSQLSRDEKPLPVVREQFAIPSLATPAGLNQPLPLAQPAMPTLGSAGAVVQRQPHKSASRETAVSHRPTPAPNRLVRTTPVVQRAPLQGGATNSPPVNKENTQSEEVSDVAPDIDMDELVEKVHRHFLRRLTIEGERRGKTSWP